MIEKNKHNLELLTFSNSFGNELSNWKLVTEKDRVLLNSLSSDYESYVSLESKTKSRALTLKIAMKRKMFIGVLQIIAPPGSLVVVSWVSGFMAMLRGADWLI